jgi:NAD-dependent deacetylase
VDKIDQLKEQLANSQKIVFFGGAGVSTESGIPDFRSSEGLYMQDSGTQVSAEEMISHTFYKRYPKEFFKYYFENLVFEEAEPNEAHIFLKDLEDEGKDVSIVTQNIDGLHQKAGSTTVHELHGSTLRNYCTQCGNRYEISELELDEEGIPRCPNDGAIVRPDIVLYEEGLDQSVIQAAVQDISEADMLMIAGTSLVVYPAAGLIHYFNGGHLVAINKSPIRIPDDALVFEDSISNVFSKL